MLSHYTNNASNEINYFIEDRERFELPNNGFAAHPFRPLRHLSNLILSRGESICRLLLESCGLLTIVHTVTTRKPNLIFVSSTGFEPMTYSLEVNCSIQLSYEDKFGRSPLTPSTVSILMSFCLITPKCHSRRSHFTTNPIGIK